MPPTYVASCRECDSTNVMFVGEHVDGTSRHYYTCGNCGHATPDRPESKDADGDVDWVPSSEVKFR